MLDTDELELDAFEILDTAKDYNDGIERLKELYAKAGPEVAGIVEDYGDQLLYKFKQKQIPYTDLPDVAPIPISDVAGNTIEEKATNWEEVNLAALDETDDPDLIVSRKQLKRQIENYASDVRRDILGRRGEGVTAFAADKFYRFAESAVGGVERLVTGENELAESLREKTDPARDENFSSLLASGAGSLVPVSAALINPIAGTIAAGADIIGRSEQSYDAALEATGEYDRAGANALLEGAANIVDILPTTRIIAGTTGKILRKVLPESTITKLIDATLEGAASEGVSQVISNIGESIGKDMDIPLTSRVVDSMLVGGILSGGYVTAHHLGRSALESRAETLLAQPRAEDPTELEPFTKTADGGLVYQQYTETSQQKDWDAVTQFVEEDIINNDTVDDYEDIKEAYPTTEPEQAPEIVKDDAFFAEETAEQPKIVVGENFESYTGDSSAADTPLYLGRVAMMLAKALGVEPKLVNSIQGGSLGVATGKINDSRDAITNYGVQILRSLAANPKKFISTLAHEIGHIVDYAQNPQTFIQPRLQNIAIKLAGLKASLVSSDSKYPAKLKKQAIAISKIWRPGWRTNTGKYAAYRAKPAEIYADVISAAVNNPRWVKKNFPDVWKELESTIGQDANLNEAWTALQDIEADPSKQYDLRSEQRLAARQQQLEKNAAANEKINRKRSIGNQLKEVIDGIVDGLFNDTSRIANIVSNFADKAFKRKGISLLKDIKDRNYAQFTMNRLDATMKQAITTIKQKGVKINDFAQYLWSNRVVNETTPTIENIRENPSPYRAATKKIRSYLRTQKDVNNILIDEILSDANIDGDVDTFINALAQIGVITDASEIPTLEEAAQKYSIDDPDRMRKARADREAIKRRMAKGLPTKAREALAAWGKAQKDLFIEDILSPNAFSVRRFLAGPGGDTVLDAEKDLASIKERHTPEQYRAIQDAAKLIHDSFTEVTVALDEAGLLTPQLKERMMLNSSNYITANVLKYFTDSSSIDGSLRKAIGSLSELGNELHSSLLKMKALTVRAAQQKAANAAVHVARLQRLPLLQIKVPKGANIFDIRDGKQKADPDNSYIIEYTDGVPALYKIPDKGVLAKALAKPEVNKVVTAFGSIVDAIDRGLGTRSILTNLSPRFAINSKFYDRFNEAIRSNSYYSFFQAFSPVTLDPELRQMRKEALAAYDHYVKTGELSGPLQDAADAKAVAVAMANSALVEADTDLTAEQLLYQEFGVEPIEVQDFFDRSGKLITDLWRKVPGIDLTARIAERDEVTTKVVGYMIGKRQGMSDAKAAMFARENFGNPDPLGGGRYAKTINKYFLFGRAHLNGLRAWANLFKDNKNKPGFYVAAAGVAARKMLLTGAAVAVVRSIFGDDEADKYQAFLNRVGTYDKINKDILPIGFVDSAGNFRPYTEVKAGEILPDWKAVALRIPQPREVSTLARLVAPMLGIVDSPATALKGFGNAAYNEVALNSKPSLQYMRNIFEYIQTGNFIDSFRNKPVLSRDVAEGTLVFPKIKEAAGYVLDKQFGSIFSPDLFKEGKTSSTTSKLEQAQKLPAGLGPLLKNFISVTNYGLIEKDKANENLKKAIDADIRQNTKDDTQWMLTQNKIFNGAVAGKTKEQRQELPPKLLQRGTVLKSWEAKVWTPLKNELRNALESGDTESYERINRTLEQLSRPYKQMLSE